MPLIAPQFGIFAQGTQAHYFVELDLLPGVTGTQAIASFKRMRSPEVAAGGVNLVVAFRGELWREVAPSHAPLPSAPFRGITTSDGRGVPATPHDAWIWISGATSDVIWDHTRAAVLAVADVATVASERQAFTYRDSRDLTGFIDGTQNPPVRRAADVALIPTGEPGEGGSHVLVMRWVHDLQSFHALPVAEQEGVIGRTKADSVELSVAEKPRTAHIARVTVERDGEELEIFRRSAPYGDLDEAGLVLRSVQLGSDSLRRDAVTHVRGVGRRPARPADGVLTPVSGAFYFAPSYNALNELAGPEEE